MTEEPIYECLRCGRTLERSEQGKYTWCSICRVAWTDGFDAGFKAHHKMMSDPPNNIFEVLDHVDDYLPFKVKHV